MVLLWGAESKHDLKKKKFILYSELKILNNSLGEKSCRQKSEILNFSLFVGSCDHTHFCGDPLEGIPISVFGTHLILKSQTKGCSQSTSHTDKDDSTASSLLLRALKSPILCWSLENQSKSLWYNVVRHLRCSLRVSEQKKSLMCVGRHKQNLINTSNVIICYVAFAL